MTPHSRVVRRAGGAVLEVLAVPGDMHRANQKLAASRLQATLGPRRGGAQVRSSMAFGAP